jgi:hypothetical protein
LAEASATVTGAARVSVFAMGARMTVGELAIVNKALRPFPIGIDANSE